MQDSIIIILSAAIILAACGFYAGFIRREPLTDWKARASLVFLASVIIWNLANNNPLMMIFKKDKTTMVIGVNRGLKSNTVIYMLTEETP